MDYFNLFKDLRVGEYVCYSIYHDSGKYVAKVKELEDSRYSSTITFEDIIVYSFGKLKIKEKEKINCHVIRTFYRISPVKYMQLISLQKKNEQLDKLIKAKLKEITL